MTYSIILTHLSYPVVLNELVLTRLVDKRQFCTIADDATKTKQKPAVLDLLL